MGMGDLWTIAQISKAMKKTVNTDKDFIAVVDGETGSGKSTFAIKLAKRIAPKTFKIKKNVIFSRDQLIEAISTAEPGSVFVVDEAINVLFKRDFATKKQKFLLRLLDMCRSKNLILLLCVPNFWAIDKHVLDKRIKLRFHIGKTGMAFLWKPSANPFTPDPWYRKYNEKVCWSWDRSQGNVSRSKGYVGYLKFNDLKESLKQIYWKHKELQKKLIKEQEEADEKKEDKEIKRLFDYGYFTCLSQCQNNQLLKVGSLVALSKIIGVNYEAFKARLKDWRRKLQDEETLMDSKRREEDLGARAI